MDRRTLTCLATLLLGLLVWFYLDVSLRTDLRHLSGYLRDPKTGEWRQPKDVVDLGKFLNQTPEYVARTNSLERLFDMVQQVNYENLFVNYDTYSDPRELEISGWPVADPDKCELELAWILDKLLVHKDYALTRGPLGRELTKFMGSFGEPGPELLAGNLNWLGSYDQCMGASLREGEIKTRYCMAKMSFKHWPSQGHPEDLTSPLVRVGVCLPETCDTLSFGRQRNKIDALLRRHQSEFMRDNLVLESLFCLPDERSPMRRVPLSGRIFLACLGAWLAALLVASVVYGRRKRRALAAQQMAQGGNLSAPISMPISNMAKDPLKANQIARLVQPNDQHQSEPEKSLTCMLIECLALQRVWKSFSSTRFKSDMKANCEEGPRVDLSFFDFLRYAMALTIILAHSFVLVSFNATSLSHRTSLNSSPHFYAFANLHKMVDVFFLISGALASYTILKKHGIEKLASPLLWVQVNLHSLIRLSSVYVLMFIYAKTLSPYTGEGPYWDYGVFQYTLRGDCMRRSWFSLILYVASNGAMPGTSCVAPAWFLVCLVQMMLFVPLITYCLYKLPGRTSKGLLLVLIALLASLQMVVKMYRQNAIKGEAFGQYGAFLMILMGRFEDLGSMSSLGRLSTFSMGCLAGYLLHLYEIGAIQEWPAWLRSKITVNLTLWGHLFIMLVPSFGRLYMKYSNHATTIDEFVYSQLVFMLLWSCLNVILILNFATKPVREWRLVKFMDHKFWHIANKLGLALYLVHWEVLQLILTSYQQGPSVGLEADVWKLFAYGSVLSHLFALPIVLLFELPVVSLVNHLIAGKRGSVSVKSSVENKKQNKHEVITIKLLGPHEPQQSSG